MHSASVLVYTILYIVLVCSISLNQPLTCVLLFQVLTPFMPALSERQLWSKLELCDWKFDLTLVYNTVDTKLCYLCKNSDICSFWLQTLTPENFRVTTNASVRNEISLHCNRWWTCWDNEHGKYQLNISVIALLWACCHVWFHGICTPTTAHGAASTTEFFTLKTRHL